MDKKSFELLSIFIYVLAAATAFYYSYENLYGRFEVEHSLDDGHGHAEELTTDQLIQQAAEDSTNSVIQINVARLLWQREEFEASYELYKRFERHGQMSADVLAELGHIYMTIRPNIESVKYFTRSLEMDSVNYGALFGLGRLMVEFGQKEQARPYFMKIVKHHPEKEIAGIAKEWLARLEDN